jgi:hypothetical protein
MKRIRRVTYSKPLRVLVVGSLCVAFGAGAAACGDDQADKNQDALISQLRKWPLASGASDKEVNCYARVLTKYADKQELAKYVTTGNREGYMEMRLSDPKKFRSEADHCLPAAAGQFAPPFPAGGQTTG